MIARHRRGRSERGAALVETVVFAPLLVLILLGAVELGSAWRFAGQMERAARSGARPATATSSNRWADREALEAVVGTIGVNYIGELDVVVIYDASIDTQVPDECLTAGVVGRCNRYGPQELAALGDPERWGCGPATLDRAWCPKERRSTRGSPIDVGVYVGGTNPWVTGVLRGDGLDTGAQVIMRLNLEGS